MEEAIELHIEGLKRIDYPFHNRPYPLEALKLLFKYRNKFGADRPGGFPLRIAPELHQCLHLAIKQLAFP